ncbi:hypothetical protein [Mycolicibacterium confluentis]|uniref:Uncharacterized protein n=1 Tax=Mycolicibacterium confluentis TaxID=28047 RepID=A0A7I7XVF9_9MYCO|nr:hypothetical protein [Mycolicibacterium confluentis]MCV7317904.1 hypothetical protein [Mycolicibacterium confluentis]ORV22923.1 hypothetical protein AWB99_25600 [Mycolicibacterium confluentis]BBZ33238.1 hypothetical protein MCNF_18430 [Mycolicibacterium confluentis]
MALADNRNAAEAELVFEDISTGIHASGFGSLPGGRTFAFGVVDRQHLVIEVYRRSMVGPVPDADDVVATAVRSCRGIDLADERSLTATVRDAIATAAPGTRLPTVG